MGIQKLNQFIKQYAPNAQQLIPLATFYGRRVAIDASYWLHSSWAGAYKVVVNSTDVLMNEPDQLQTIKVWLSHLQNFLRKLLGHGITPVFVFDGRPPDEKRITLNKRREDKQKITNKLNAYQNVIQQTDILLQTPEMMNELRKLLKQTNHPQTHEFDLLKMILQTIGIPVLQAIGEADQLCSMLCVEGQVDGVFSIDTDNLTYGSPLLLTGFKHEHFTAVRLNKILEESRLPFSSFVDLCIMCGCDYNTNIRGISYNTAYKLIQTHHSIDQLPQHYDVTCFNYISCRRLFSQQPSTTLCSGPLTLNMVTTLPDNARDILEPYGLDSWLQELSTYYHNFPVPASQKQAEITSPIRPTKLKLVNSTSVTTTPIATLAQKQLEYLNSRH